MTQITLNGSEVCDDSHPALLPDIPIGDLQPGQKVPDQDPGCTNAALTNQEFNVECVIVYQIVKHLYMRCVSTGSRIFLFHVAYSVGATVEGKDITCKCHKVCNR